MTTETIDIVSLQITALGIRIKEIRQSKSLKLYELAEMANVSKGLLSKVENGRTTPSLPVFFAICNALETPFPLFFDTPNFQPTTINKEE